MALHLLHGLPWNLGRKSPEYSDHREGYWELKVETAPYNEDGTQSQPSNSTLERDLKNTNPPSLLSLSGRNIEPIYILSSFLQVPKLPKRVFSTFIMKKLFTEL